MAYDGTDYSGWQMQKGVITIQSEIERVLSRIFNVERVKVIGASRTDAGVHALGQTFNFKTTKEILPEKLILGMNSLLPNDIYINRLEYTNRSFHSRFFAKGKYYTYNFIYPNNPLKSRYAYIMSKKPDYDKVVEAAKLFVGEKDFKAFRNMGSKKEKENTVCNISEFRVELRDDGMKFHIKGNRFLYNMIRIISGTLLSIGLGKLDICDIEKAFETNERKFAGKTISPQGLVLEKVYYDDF